MINKDSTQKKIAWGKGISGILIALSLLAMTSGCARAGRKPSLKPIGTIYERTLPDGTTTVQCDVGLEFSW